MSSLDDTFINSLQCIGERISSFRTYIRRASPFLRNQAQGVAPVVNVIPFGITAMSQNGIANVIPEIIVDVYSSVASLFLYSRGSVRLKFVTPNAIESSPGTVAGTVGYLSPKYLYKLGTTFNVPTQIVFYGAYGASAYSNLDVTNVQTILSSKENQELQIPHYHRFPLRNNIEHTMNTQYPYSMHSGVSTGSATEVLVQRVTASIFNSTMDSLPTTVYRGTADDCTMSYFLSVPPMVNLNADFP